MSTARESTETSVTFSLAELAKIEQQRVREEDEKRARERERAARERHEAEEKRRREESAEIARAAEARAKRARAEAEEQARVEARERAAADVLRIEAEAKARLEAANAARAHELAVLRVQTEGGRKRLTIALAAALVLAVTGVGATAYGFSQKLAQMGQETDRLREGQHALAEEREQAKSTQLAALDKRHAALRARETKGADEARSSAEAARNAIDRKTLDLDRLRAFGDALDALQTKLDRLDKLARLDRRLVDLDVWATERKQREATAEAHKLAARARAMDTDEGILAYEASLDDLRKTLARAASPSGRVTTTARHVGDTCLDGDPGCGPDGKRIF